MTDELLSLTFSAMPPLVVGVDFGTLSGRAVVVRVHDGAELGSAVTPYPHAVLERALPDGTPLPPEWALQVPADYVEVLRTAVPAALAAAGADPADVVGIGTDFTACTMVPTTADGTPLCELPEFAGEPHAYVKLWKHHAAQGQADRINALARERGEPWLPRYGGLISSEWEFAKGLQVLEEAPERLRGDAALGRGGRLDRLAAHRHLRPQRLHRRLQGHPPGRRVPLRGVPAPRSTPAFARFVPDKLEHPLGRLGDRAGGLTAQAAAWTGLPEGIAVCVGNVDAHVTVPAADAIEPGLLVAIMGTSTCHVMNGTAAAPRCPACAGWSTAASPRVSGATRPGRAASATSSAGSSSTACRPPTTRRPRRRGSPCTRCSPSRPPRRRSASTGWSRSTGTAATARCWSTTSCPASSSARPWPPGPRTSTGRCWRPPRSAPAGSSRRSTTSGVPVSELVVAGGLLTNALLMQIYADVTGLPLSIIGSAQGPALGAAIHAAVAAGAHPDVHAAAKAMGSRRRGVYQPDPERAAAYDELYAEYLTLHDYFGRGANDVMHRLKARRRAAAAAKGAR